MKNYKTIIAVVAAGLACSVTTSNATLVANNGTAIVGGDPAALDGLTLVYTGTQNIFDLPNLPATPTVDAGTIQTLIYSGINGDTLGGLTFEYILNVTQGQIFSMGLNGYGTSAVNVESYQGVPATLANLSGGTLNINWFANVLAGQSSTIVVDTSMLGFTSSPVNFLDGSSGSSTVETPVAVPEASTVVAGALMLLPLGIGAMRSLRKERVV